MSVSKDPAAGQTGSVAPPPEARSFSAKSDTAADGREDGYETDVTSRNDAEGATARSEILQGSSDVEAKAARSPDGRYETDAFSRNDAEGASALGVEAASAPKPKTGTSSVEAKPDAGGVHIDRA